jgi:hypothetical protein
VTPLERSQIRSFGPKRSRHRSLFFGRAFNQNPSFTVEAGKSRLSENYVVIRSSINDNAKKQHWKPDESEIVDSKNRTLWTITIPARFRVTSCNHA